MRSVRSQELCETLFLAGSILCTGSGVAIAVGIFLMIAGFFLQLLSYLKVMGNNRLKMSKGLFQPVLSNAS